MTFFLVRIGEIKTSKVFEIGNGESVTKISSKRLSQSLNQARTVFCAVATFLLLFNNAFTNLPICLRHDGIDSHIGTTARL